MRISDWSSDVCSSDLILLATLPGENSVTAKSRNEAARRVTRDSSSLRAVKEIILRRGPAASCLAHRQLVAEHAVGRLHAEAADPRVVEGEELGPVGLPDLPVVLHQPPALRHSLGAPDRAGRPLRIATPPNPGGIGKAD